VTGRASRSPASTDGRTRAAQGVAFVALLAALVGALGPAERVRTTYSWPAALPSGTPERVWYAPLPLVRHRPETLRVALPCEPAPALRGGPGPSRVLATARRPRRAGALDVVRTGNVLTISAGEQVLPRVPVVSGGASEGCAYELALEGSRWSLRGGPENRALAGELDAMPAVFGFFSELDLRAEGAPAVEARTAVHEARPLARQKIAWTVAVVGIAAALALVALRRRPRPLATARRAAAAVRTDAHPVDALVAVGLVAWWVLSPAFFDDGWIYAKLTSFASSGGFSSYYLFLGTNAPLGYWLDWLQHWLAQSTTAALWLRLPAVLCVAALWVLCRVALTRLRAADSRDLALWTMASVFLVGAVAWGMTLRPEPLAALLVTGVLLCALALRERATAAPLAVAAILVPLAFTAHPSGVVAFAPLLVVAPRIWRFVRANVPAATAIAMAAIALMLVVLFLGADLDQRRVESQTISALDTATDSWFDEPARYELLATPPYATPIRRSLVALIGLTLLAFALRASRSPDRRGLSSLPALTLAVGLVLLVPTPSKWPSHFGTFIGLLAIAAAVEMQAVRRGQSRAAAPYALVAAAAVGGAWAWRVRGPWNPVDLRTLDWRPALEGWVPLAAVSVLVPLVVLAVAIVAARRRPGLGDGAPRRAASWTAGLVGVPFLVFTVGVIAVDTARTDGWTHGRQTAEALHGRSECGLGDELLIAERDDPNAAEPLARRLGKSGSASLVLPNLVPYFPCARLPRLRNGLAEVPDTIVSYPNEFSPIRYPLTSPFVGVLDLYPLRRLRLEPTPDGADSEIEVFEIDRTIPGGLPAPATESSFTS
jgi:hypothetical protein